MSFTLVWTKGQLLESSNKNRDSAPENLPRNILHSTFKSCSSEKEALTCDAHILGDGRQGFLRVILPTGKLR